MPNENRARQRIDHLQGLLDTEYEKLQKLETDISVAPPRELRASLELTLKKKTWPRIRELEDDLDGCQTVAADVKHVSDDEAAALCASLPMRCLRCKRVRKRDGRTRSFRSSQKPRIN